jgi:hypothetical protein
MKTAALTVLLSLSVFAIEPRNVEATLGQVKRVYVDQLGGGPTSDQMRDMIIAALQESGLFTITENPERADASLHGSSDDKAFTQEHQTSESIGFHASDGSGTRTATSIGTATSSDRSLSAGVSENESSHIKERRHEAVAAVHLVNAAGDVIWSTTQESNGAKFRGAMADVADKIVRRLADETKKARTAEKLASLKPAEASSTPQPGPSSEPSAAHAHPSAAPRL